MTSIIIGASSGLGRALAEEIAKQASHAKTTNTTIIISARAEEDLAAVARSINLKYNVNCIVFPLDLAADDEALISYVKSIYSASNDHLDLYICAGQINEHDNFLELTPTILEQMVKMNFLQLAKLLLLFIQHQTSNLHKNKATIISSIAAPTPRRRNIAYTAAKKALESFCQSWQHAGPENTNWHIALCRLGYVDTAMNFGQKVLFPVASKESAAKNIIHIHKNTHQRLYYTPNFWFLIVSALRLTPWCIYKRLKF
jgi:short-subunit dehydrogenase